MRERGSPARPTPVLGATEKQLYDHDRESRAGGLPLLRSIYLAAGVISLGLAILGVALPLLPTVPFLILAAFCFGRSDPRVERWLLEHPKFGPSIRDWRERRAISRKGKIAATVAFAASIVLALFVSPFPWSLAPVAAALIAGSWIWTRPEA